MRAGDVQSISCSRVGSQEPLIFVILRVVNLSGLSFKSYKVFSEIV